MGKIGYIWLTAAAIAAIAAWLAIESPSFIARALTPEPEPLALCEHGIKQAIRSPASYRRIEMTMGPVESNRQQIFVQFDAANAYGTPIRGLARCELGVWDHGPLPSLLVIEIDGEKVDSILVTMAEISWSKQRREAGY